MLKEKAALRQIQTTIGCFALILCILELLALDAITVICIVTRLHYMCFAFEILNLSNIFFLPILPESARSHHMVSRLPIMTKKASVVLIGSARPKTVQYNTESVEKYRVSI